MRVYLATPGRVDCWRRYDPVDPGGRGEDDALMTRTLSLKPRDAVMAIAATRAGHATIGAPHLRK